MSAKKTNWFAGWNSWEPTKRVSEVHEHAGKYCVVVSLPGSKLGEIIADNGGAKTILKNSINKGYLVAGREGSFVLYAAFTEEDARAMNYSQAQRVFGLIKRKQPAQPNWLCKIFMGNVEVLNEPYRECLQELFGMKSVIR